MMRRSQPSHGQRRRTSERCKIWKCKISKGGPSEGTAVQREDTDAGLNQGIMGVHLPLSQWCMLQFPPISSKFIHLFLLFHQNLEISPLYSFNLRFFLTLFFLPLFWPWCTWALALYVLDVRAYFKQDLQLHKTWQLANWQSNNCTFYTAHFEFTTAQIMINCTLKYALLDAPGLDDGGSI